ncbi:hypothetical protein ABT282_31035 [Streptomyces sp. NPDC000927]|uniref:hypothetical protein n=1 Tax=Streptomyces sp. NPDC000927 TaxID=3154371 RepID=UPI00331F959D
MKMISHIAVAASWYEDQSATVVARLDSDGICHVDRPVTGPFSVEWPEDVCTVANEVGAHRVLVSSNDGGPLMVEAVRLAWKSAERKGPRPVFRPTWALTGLANRAETVTRWVADGRVVLSEDLLASGASPAGVSATADVVTSLLAA